MTTLDPTGLAHHIDSDAAVLIDRTGQHWHAHPERLQLSGDALIGGVRRDPAEKMVVQAPATGDPLGTAASTTAEEAHEAIRLARTEFGTGDWARARPADRAAALERWADLLHRHCDELAVLICAETGKPVRDCVEVDIAGCVRAIRWSAAAIGKHGGHHPDTGPHALAVVAREPAGVVAVVTPWNFPLAALGYEVAPALSLGNAVLVKPSEHAPYAVLRAAELAHQSGVPGGALAVLPGGPSTGAALGRHADVDVIMVIGSALTGRAFRRYAAGTGAQVWCELGGKSTAIVCADTPDLEQVARKLVWGMTFNAGQMCTGVTRILADRTIADDLTAELETALDRLVIGDPRDWDTDVGPMITTEAAVAVVSAIDRARADGAVLRRGGPLTTPPTRGGAYLTPALLTAVTATMPIVVDEVFGPVSSLIAVGGPDEAVAAAAGFGTGIAASVWTASLDTALSVAGRLKVGTVWVNDFEADDLTVPVGDLGRGGSGHSKGLAVLDKYSRWKTTWVTVRAR
ncbi:aldehyde dehydrogenase family protein [Nocardia sp. NPDC050710]|uniref:aldehyde dehydrogenase family protein n=1 Tax=Nocardia sp. NPDC050710 TaxID=3157220 RepID=UPI003401FE11